MKHLPQYKEILAGLEIEAVLQASDGNIPKEVIEFVSLKRKTTHDIKPTGEYRLPSDITYLLETYDVSRTSLLGLNFNITEETIEANRHYYDKYGFFMLCSDNLGNNYVIKPDSGSIGCFGYADEPQAAFKIAGSFEKLIRILSKFPWESFPDLSKEDYSNICEYLEVSIDNKYWYAVRRNGEPVI